MLIKKTCNSLVFFFCIKKQNKNNIDFVFVTSKLIVYILHAKSADGAPKTTASNDNAQKATTSGDNVQKATAVIYFEEDQANDSPPSGVAATSSTEKTTENGGTCFFYKHHPVPILA